MKDMAGYHNQVTEKEEKKKRSNKRPEKSCTQPENEQPFHDGATTLAASFLACSPFRQPRKTLAGKAVSLRNTKCDWPCWASKIRPLIKLASLIRRAGAEQEVKRAWTHPCRESKRGALACSLGLKGYSTTRPTVQNQQEPLCVCFYV